MLPREPVALLSLLLNELVFEKTLSKSEHEEALHEYEQARLSNRKTYLTLEILIHLNGELLC